MAYARAPQDVRQQDYDLIIDMGAAVEPQIDGNATVLRFELGRASGSMAKVGKNRSQASNVVDARSCQYRLQRTRGQRVSAFTVMNNLDDRLDFRALIAETILPNITRAGHYTVIWISGPEDYIMRPMVAEECGDALSAIIDFPELNSYWSLPSETTDRVRWVQFFPGGHEDH